MVAIASGGCTNPDGDVSADAEGDWTDQFGTELYD
jgi:hypothetical protein